MAIKRGLKEANIFLVPNPVDTATFFPAIPNVKQSLRKTLGLSPSSFVITCVANFIDYKRHIDLVQAFKIALETNPAIELCLVGQGKEEATIRAWVAKETLDTKIHVLGQRQDVPDILRASDCFVLPSLFEGMSVAIMEAMASGLPVIASDIPENRVLINNRVSGVLVPANNPPVLATTLTELINCDPVIRNDLGNQARQHIENNYSLSAITRYWESVYTAVAKT
jgi:glycosyltransferase involved in cell wall biosynthesis